MLRKIYRLILSTHQERARYVSEETLLAILYRENTAGWQDAPRWRLLSERRYGR